MSNHQAEKPHHFIVCRRHGSGSKTFEQKDGNHLELLVRLHNRSLVFGVLWQGVEAADA